MNFKEVVSEQKIEMIHKMLADPIVGEAWAIFIAKGRTKHAGIGADAIKERMIAWDNYTKVRDVYLGLPPLVVQYAYTPQTRFQN